MDMQQGTFLHFGEIMHNITEKNDINERLKDFFDEMDSEKIVEIPERFKIKLELDERSYKYLSSAKNLKEFVEVITTSGAGALSGGAYYWATATAFSRFLLVFGIGSGWWVPVAVGGGVAFAGICLIKYCFYRADKLTMDHIPKFINTPLDILGASLADVLVYPAVKISICDGHFSKSEYDFIVNSLYEEWGINKEYCVKVVKAALDSIYEYSYQATFDLISGVCGQNKELNRTKICTDVCRLVEGLVYADGEFTIDEHAELIEMRKILS